MQWRKKKEELPPPTASTDQTTNDKDTPVDNDEADKKDEGKPKAPLSNYWRILSYGSKGEHGLMLGAFVASSASGVALPLMQIVFGNLTGTFNSYSTNPEGAQSDFDSTVDRYS